MVKIRGKFNKQKLDKQQRKFKKPKVVSLKRLKEVINTYQDQFKRERKRSRKRERIQITNIRNKIMDFTINLVH